MESQFNSQGLHVETIKRMENFYGEVYLEEVKRLLELTIIYHSDPSRRNFLSVENSLTMCREQMIRQQVFKTHS